MSGTSRQVKNSFTAGELAPSMLGRADLRAYANGAARLRNVVLHPTGGLSRRPGLRHLHALPGPARLVPFEFNTEQTYLLALCEGAMQVVMGDGVVAATAAPWAGWMLPNLCVTQSADTLLVTHPHMPPQRVTRTGHASWQVGPWPWINAPLHRFMGTEGVSLTPSATTGNVSMAADGGVFGGMAAGTALRFRGVRGVVTQVLSPGQAMVQLSAPLPDTAASTDWEEAAFSPSRGWPTSACFHQDRLVLGGSRDLPNRLWLSRSGALWDFDLGRGLDDEGIEFGLMGDQVNAIRHVFSGRHLQVFTTGGEWMVSGDPLTPSSIQVTRQTRIGSSPARSVAPVDVDGATVFAARSGRAIHEFAYTEVSQAYQSSDLGLVASHLMREPVSMAYDQVRRLLHVVMADGGCATLTLFRAEQVTGWTRQETQGAFRAVAELDGRVFFAVERAGTWRLERLDEALNLDAALDGTSPAPQDRWSGMAHLEGQVAGVLADGSPRAPATVSGGAVLLDPPASAVQLGLPFAHEVEPLPPEMQGALGARRAPLRLVGVTFRLLDTPALSADLGRGMQPVAFRRLDTALLDAPPAPFTGDVRLSALGWRRDATKPLWRIGGDAPLPMTLLSVSTEMRTTD